MNKKTNFMIRHCVHALLFLGAFTASLANAQTSDAQSVSDIKAKAQAGDPDALGILSYLINRSERKLRDGGHILLLQGFLRRVECRAGRESGKI